MSVNSTTNECWLYLGPRDGACVQDPDGCCFSVVTPGHVKQGETFQKNPDGSYAKQIHKVTPLPNPPAPQAMGGESAIEMEERQRIHDLYQTTMPPFAYRNPYGEDEDTCGCRNPSGFTLILKGESMERSLPSCLVSDDCTTQFFSWVTCPIWGPFYCTHSAVKAVHHCHLESQLEEMRVEPARDAAAIAERGQKAQEEAQARAAADKAEAEAMKALEVQQEYSGEGFQQADQNGRPGTPLRTFSCSMPSQTALPTLSEYGAFFCAKHEKRS